MTHIHNPDSWSLERCATQGCEEFKKLKVKIYIGHKPIEEINKNDNPVKSSHSYERIRERPWLRHRNDRLLART